MTPLDPTWAELTPDQRLDSRIATWVEPPGLEFESPEAAASYKARVTRVKDALLLEKAPDRVPVSLTNFGFYPATWAGLTPFDAMTDTPRAAKAWLDFNHEFQGDAMVGPLFQTIPAKMFEIMDYHLYSWPGHGVPPEASYQYSEDEYMLAEEYDDLIDDPGDYLWRQWLPRVCGAFEGFGLLSSPVNLVELPFTFGHMLPYASPPVQASFDKLTRASQVVGEWAQVVFPVIGQLMASGFPGHWGGSTKAPYDFIGDTLRGTRAMSLDLFRRPEKVIEACDRLAPLMVKWVTKMVPPASTPLIFIPLHKGADGFMSDEQFRTFYWPSFRKVLIGLIEEGFIPSLFAEGGFGSRLEVIADLPKGRTVWLFDQTDMARAKEILGDVACIQGNVPLSLLHAGTPEQVTAYCRDLIKSAGKGGGFILDAGAVVDFARAENVHAMINAAKEYGVY